MVRSGSREWCAVAAFSVALAAASGAAQEDREVDLGGGLAVVEQWRACTYTYNHTYDGTRCPSWQPVGFEFGDRELLHFARAFARVPALDRVVATYRDVGGRAGMLYSDDRGASWHESRWGWRHVANAVAFDARSRFGVAVGESGYVWNTDDGGETWTDRGSSAGVLFTDVAVVGRTFVMADSQGRIWRSRAGGFERRLITESREFSLETEDDAIVVITPRRTFRVRRDGGLERR